VKYQEKKGNSARRKRRQKGVHAENGADTEGQTVYNNWEYRPYRKAKGEKKMPCIFGGSEGGGWVEGREAGPKRGGILTIWNEGRVLKKRER